MSAGRLRRVPGRDSFPSTIGINGLDTRINLALGMSRSRCVEIRDQGRSGLHRCIIMVLSDRWVLIACEFLAFARPKAFLGAW